MDSGQWYKKVSRHQPDPLLGRGRYVKASVLQHKMYCQLITQDHASDHVHLDIKGPVVVIPQLENDAGPTSECWQLGLRSTVPWLWPVQSWSLP